VVRYDAVKAAVARRKYRPLFLIDIAVPRDIDPRCDSLQNVYLFDVDDLQQVVEANRATRRTEAVKAEDIARRETDLMLAWIAEAQVVPTIVSLREKLTRLKDEELERLRRANPDLPPEAIKAMERFAHSLINKVLHEPTATLRRSSASDHHQMLVAAVRSLFDLSDTPSERNPAPTGAAGRT
jgi:glutamyl-tRNA reductase